jgi:hypothetical protein
MSMWILAHGGGDEGSLFVVPLIVVAGGLTLVVLEKRTFSRSLLLGIAGALMVLLSAALWLPPKLHTCGHWRTRLLEATSAFVSASGNGSQTAPGLTQQEHLDMQRRVVQIIDERPFGCL